MASPPFDINQALPGDNDIVSQHPFNARAMRDIVESWLLINHNNLGHHRYLEMPNIGGTEQPTVPTASANVTVIYMDGLGVPHLLSLTTDQFLGSPPGTVIHFAGGVLPGGYLVADGSAVSRSTFSALFTAISTGYGPGDGSTTFNLPNINGRVIAGEDAAGVRLRAAYLGTTATQGGVGGGDSTTLAMTNLPASGVSISGSTSGYTPTVGAGVGATAVGGGSGPIQVSSPGTANANVFAVGTFFSINGFSSLSVSGGTAALGSSTPFSSVQPTIVLKALIKF